MTRTPVALALSLGASALAIASPAHASRVLFSTAPGQAPIILPVGAVLTQAQGMALSPLTPGEAKLAMERNLEPRPQARAWEYWSVRLKKAGEYPKAGALSKRAKKR